MDDIRMLFISSGAQRRYRLDSEKCVGKYCMAELGMPKDELGKWMEKIKSTDSITCTGCTESIVFPPTGNKATLFSQWKMIGKISKSQVL